MPHHIQLHRIPPNALEAPKTRPLAGFSLRGTSSRSRNTPSSEISLGCSGLPAWRTSPNATASRPSRTQDHRSSSDIFPRSGSARRSRTVASSSSSPSVMSTGLNGSCPRSATYCKAWRMGSEGVTPNRASSRSAIKVSIHDTLCRIRFPFMKL